MFFLILFGIHTAEQICRRSDMKSSVEALILCSAVNTCNYKQLNEFKLTTAPVRLSMDSTFNINSLPTSAGGGLFILKPSILGGVPH